MKILVETLESITKKDVDGNDSISWIVNKSKTIEFIDGDKITKISDATEKLNQLKLTLPANQKLRVLEYNNDEPDETRTPCKILFEA